MASTSKNQIPRSFVKPKPLPPSLPMKVKFVRPLAGVKINPEMERAFSLMTEEDQAEWIEENDIDNVDSADATTMVFICQEFSGMTFNKLKTRGFRIVSPHCVLMCTQRHEPIPKTQHPMLSATMSGIKVSCTSISRQLRLDLHEKIQMMGGEVMRELTSRATHLVCGEVGSKKYLVACQLGIKVMLPEWIEECYKRCTREFIHATDPVFDVCRCSIFHGFNITVSNLTFDERKQVQKLVTENGGIYSGDLRVDVTTHLILGQPPSEENSKKHLVAMRKSIPCLKLSWILDSVAKGFCLDSCLYLIEEGPSSGGGKKETSTPVKNQEATSTALPNCSNVSSINCTINDTIMSNATITPEVSRKQGENKKNNDVLSPEKWLDDVDLSVVSRSGLFLDGCKILLSGFPLSTTEKMRKMLNFAGATRLSQITDSVSHVVVGGKLEPEHKKLLEEQYSPHVVHIGWIAESLKLSKPAEESKFRYQSSDFPVAALNSTTIQESFCDKTLTSVEISPRNVSVVTNKTNNDGSTFDDVIAQYLDNSSTFQGKVFHGFTFAVAGFPNDDVLALKQMVAENGGEFVDEPSPSTVVDYGIVPIPACHLNFKAVNVGTNYWLQHCVTEVALLNIEDQPIYGPIEVDLDARPLANCVLCFTQYSGSERECLIHIATILGAKCQDFFTRAINHRRGLVPNSHLVAMKPEGSKYDGAIAWKIPVVNASWLIDCLIKGSKLDESDYLVKHDHDQTGDQVTIGNETVSTAASSSPTTVKKHTILQKEALSSTTGLDNSSSTAASFSISDLKTPIRDIWNKPKNDVFKTPTPSAAKLPSTAERLHTLREGLRTRYDDLPCLQNSRVTEVMKAEGALNTSAMSSPGDTSILNTPGKFMNPDVRFDPNLKLNEVMARVDTPVRTDTKNVSPTSLLPIDDLLSLRVRQALRDEMKVSTGSGDADDWQHGTEVDESIDEKTYLLSLRPLAGVVLAASKKLTLEQSELYSLADKLGAKCKWIYEKACTHFVYRGKANDSSRELKLAKDDKKIIVSPEWIRACSTTNTRVDENSYPYTYNPNMSLQVMNQRDTTPLRNSQKSKDIECSSSSSASSLLSTSRTDKPAAVAAANVTTKKQHSSRSDDAKIKATTERKLDEILAATNVAKDKRKKGLHQTCLNSSNSSANNTIGSNYETPRMNKLQTAPQPDGLVENPSEVAESVPITWDDPTSREERAKLTAKLQLKGRRLASDEEAGDDNLNSMHNQSTSSIEPEGFTSPSSLKENAPVSKAPSSYVFMFTGPRSDAERQRSAEAVAKCGGRVLDLQNFHTECTHLVTKLPSRSEKFLAAIAAGRWVLHISYLDECFKKGCFVDETAYEFGNENLKLQLPEENAKLYCSARKWRQEVQSQVSIGAQKVGAYKDWTAIILTKQNRVGGIKRLLTAGGATVLSAQPPFSSIDGATHAFIESEGMTLEVADLQVLMAAGVLCVKPEYIWVFLTEGASVAQKFYIPEVLPLLASSSSDCNCTNSYAKRKSGDSNSSNKRTRQM